jgi:hypothetical protein
MACVKLNQEWKRHQRGAKLELPDGVADLLVNRMRIAEYANETKIEAGEDNRAGSGAGFVGTDEGERKRVSKRHSSR